MKYLEFGNLYDLFLCGKMQFALADNLCWHDKNLIGYPFILLLNSINDIRSGIH